MKHLLALLFLAVIAPLSAATTPMHTPTRAVGDCAITGISGATPAVVTVSNIAHCGGLTNGQTIFIWGAHNTGTVTTYSAVNSHLESAADATGPCRVVAGVSGNTFQVKGCDGSSNITNNGTYSYGGRVAQSTVRTRKDRPIVLFDGTGGSVENCLSSTGANGCGHIDRLEYIAQSSYTIPDLTIKHRDISGVWTAIAIIRWYREGRPSSGANYDAVRAGLLNSGKYIMPNAGCNGAANCGQPVSEYMDYVYESNQTWLFNFNAGLSALTTLEQQELAEYLFADVDWTRGGYNYTGTSLALQSFKTVSGTINFDPASATITGNSTLFQSQTVVGDWMLVGGGGNYDRWARICAIPSDTEITLCWAGLAGMIAANNTSYKVVAERTPGTHVGFLGISHYNQYSTLCQPGYPANTSCPGIPGNANGGFDQNNNHNAGRVPYLTLLGLTFADIDPKAKWLASSGMFIYQHRFQGMWSNMAGLSQTSASYHVFRFLPQAMTYFGGVQFSFADSPDYLDFGGSNGAANSAAWWNAWGNLALTFKKPARYDAFQTGGFQADFGHGGVWMIGGLLHNLYRPNGALAPAIRYFLENDAGSQEYSVDTLRQSGNGHFTSCDLCPIAYIGNRPTVVAARSTETSFGTLGAPLHDGCLTIWQPRTWNGSGCLPDPRWFMASRSGSTLANTWNGQGATVWFNQASCGMWDHAHQIHDVGMTIAANGKILYGGDGVFGGYFSLAGGSIVVPDAEANLKNCADTGFGGAANGNGKSVPLYASTSAYLATAAVNILDHVLGAAGFLSLSRAVSHAAKTAAVSYVLQRDDFTANASKTLVARHHFWRADGGTFALNRAAGTVSNRQTATTVARHNAKFLNGTINTHNNSDVDGSCPGCTGNSFRVTQSLAGTQGSLFTLHQISNNDATLMPSYNESDVGSWHVVEVLDGTNPVIFVSAPNAANNLTSVSAFSASGGQLAITGGLAPETYAVRVNGNVVGGCGSIAVLAGQHSLNCNGLPAGSITVQQESAPSDPPTITTGSPLANCAVNVPCSRTLALTGGTGPFTWTLQSGTLPAGLSLSSGGVISGTPTTAQTRVFTVRVTDALAEFDDQSLSLTISAARPVRFRLRSRKAADMAVVEYGPTSGLGSSSSISCASGCVIPLSAPTSAPLYFRVRFTLGGSPVTPFTSIRSIQVP